MRVVIVDSDSNTSRDLAASVERLLPAADVLLYADADAALAGALEHQPDVVFVAPTAGPEAVVLLRAGTDATVVGIVTAPDPSDSERYIAAGAHVVAAQPLDDLAIRAALRQSGGGIPAN